MHDQRDHREYQQQMYQAAGYGKQSETANPRDQQNNEKNSPDRHMFSPFVDFLVQLCCHHTRTYARVELWRTT